MFAKILVPLDGSPLAEKALPFAVYLAEHTGGSLVLVRAVDTWATTVHDSIEKELERTPQAEAELAAVAARLASAGLAIEQEVHPGEAAAIIEHAAASTDVGLIVMSTHGRGGIARWAYGSVAERVLRSSSRPVLVVPAQCESVWTASVGHTILVPLDGSPLAEQALGPAKLLASALNADVALLQIIEPPNVALASSAMGPGMGYYEAFDVAAWVDQARPYAEEIAANLREAGFTATATTTSGYAAAAIHEFGVSRSVAATVMASHGRGGIARLALGSVTLGVVQRTTAPVLVVRSGSSKARSG